MAPRPDDRQPRRTRLVQYWDYLEVPKLLSLQSPFPAGFDGETRTVYDPDIDVRADVQADAPLPPLSGDELFFISIHQSFEIWFKVCLTSMGIARDQFLAAAEDGRDEKRLARAVHHLDRVATVLRMLPSQIEVLATLPGREFLRMRTRLGTSSGFESYQFRLIERHLGLLADPDQYVLSPPQHQGIVAFIASYRRALANADGPSPAVQTKVGEVLYEGTALEGLASEAGGVAQRRREIDHVEQTIRAAHDLPSLKDAWFAWLARRLANADAPIFVPSVTLLGVLGGVGGLSQVKGLVLSDETVTRRERVLRRMASAHKFEEWFRRGHELQRSAWTPATADPLHEFAAEVQRRQRDTWDAEIRAVFGETGLLREAPPPPKEEFVAVIARFPVVDRVLRAWLRQPRPEDGSFDGDSSFLALTDVQAELSSQRLYGRLSDAAYEAIGQVLPEIAQHDPRPLAGGDLVRAVDRLADAEARGVFAEAGADVAELVWTTIIGSLRTSLSSAIEPCREHARRGVRCRYALLYFSRAERVRRLIEDATSVEDSDRDAAGRAYAVGGLARRCLDRLLDVDEAVANWRAHHVAVIARILGTRKGTAGTGTQYLAESLGPRGMPEIVDGIGRVERPSESSP